MLWDTAGQEEFDAITKAYYRGAQACVVAFSTVDRASFEAVRRWKKKVGTTLTKDKSAHKKCISSPVEKCTFIFKIFADDAFGKDDLIKLEIWL